MQKYDLRYIYAWPLKTRALVIGLLCALVFNLGYRLDISSVNNSLTTARQKEKDLKVEMELVVNKIISIKNNISQFKALQTSLQEWQTKLVAVHALPELLNDILKIGANNKLQFRLFSPGTKMKEKNYFKTPIKVIAVGDYQSLANFMSQVANMPQIVVIGDFTIVKDTAAIPDIKNTNLTDSASALILTMTLYVYNLPEK